MHVTPRDFNRPSSAKSRSASALTQAARRFVEHDDLCATADRGSDLHHLPIADGEIAELGRARSAGWCRSPREAPPSRRRSISPHDRQNRDVSRGIVAEILQDSRPQVEVPRRRRAPGAPCPRCPPRWRVPCGERNSTSAAIDAEDLLPSVRRLQSRRESFLEQWSCPALFSPQSA